MTSSLAHQASQRSFQSNRFFPMDLSQSALYNLYANGVSNVNCLNQLVQSANFLGIKDIADIEPALQPTAFTFANLDHALVKPKNDSNPLTFASGASPPTLNQQELINFCENPLQNNLLFQMLPPSSSASSDFLSIQPQIINSCDSDGSFSSSHSMTNETPKLNINNNNTHGEKRRKELVKDQAYFERRRKNNDAAKRSRDSRRKKEDEVAIKAALLEQENLRLRFEVERLRIEIERHRLVALNPSLSNQSPFSSGTLQSAP